MVVIDCGAMSTVRLRPSCFMAPLLFERGGNNSGSRGVQSGLGSIRMKSNNRTGNSVKNMFGPFPT